MPLPVADGQAQPVEIHVLHTQAKTLVDAQEAAIRQFDDKTIAPAQLRKNQAHFANRQHARQMSLLGGQLEPKVSKLQIVVFLVKKDDRIESDIAVQGEMSKKRFDFRRPRFGRMTLADEVNVFPDPLQVGLFCLEAIAAQADIGDQ